MPWAHQGAQLEAPAPGGNHRKMVSFQLSHTALDKHHAAASYARLQDTLLYQSPQVSIPHFLMMETNSCHRRWAVCRITCTMASLQMLIAVGIILTRGCGGKWAGPGPKRIARCSSPHSQVAWSVVQPRRSIIAASAPTAMCCEQAI